MQLSDTCLSPPRLGLQPVDHRQILGSSRANEAMEFTMKIRIERAACVGNARCAAISEALFPLDDDGYIDSDGFDVAAGDELLAKNGARACPERIIFVIDEDGKQIWPPVKKD
jgi:ferredoxin